MVRSNFFKKIFGWAVFALLFLPGAARANFDLTIEIVDLQVTNDWADWFSDADVYVYFWVKRPQRGYGGMVGCYQTSTLYEQDEGTHPHKGSSFTAVHYDPLQVEFRVYDEDWGFDDIMAIGILPIGIAGPYTKTVVGDYATITIKVTVAPSYCGGTRTTVSHSPSTPVWPATSPLEVVLDLHVKEDEPTKWLVLREYIPASLAFITAEPMPDAVGSLVLDGEPAPRHLPGQFHHNPRPDHYGRRDRRRAADLGPGAARPGNPRFLLLRGL